MRKLNIQCLVETVLYILFATALLAIIIKNRNDTAVNMGISA